MDDDNEFGEDPAKLAEFVARRGETHNPYVEAILAKGLFGAYLLDNVNDEEKFAAILEKVGMTEVRCKT